MGAGSATTEAVTTGAGCPSIGNCSAAMVSNGEPTASAVVPAGANGTEPVISVRTQLSPIFSCTSPPMRESVGSGSGS